MRASNAEAVVGKGEREGMSVRCCYLGLNDEWVKQRREPGTFPADSCSSDRGMEVSNSTEHGVNYLLLITAIITSATT